MSRLTILLVFIYSSSDDAPIKLKMLYSTVKAVANGAAEDQGLKIDKKVYYLQYSMF